MQRISNREIMTSGPQTVPKPRNGASLGIELKEDALSRVATAGFVRLRIMHKNCCLNIILRSEDMRKTTSYQEPITLQLDFEDFVKFLLNKNLQNLEVEFTCDKASFKFYLAAITEERLFACMPLSEYIIMTYPTS